MDSVPQNSAVEGIAVHGLPAVSRTKSQMLRFLMVGVLNTAVGYGLFAGFTWMGMAYPLAIALATLLGVAFNFQSTGRLVFGGADRSRLLRFLLAYAFIYLTNVAAVALLTYFGLSVFLANGLCVLPLALLSFMLQRRFVFSHSV
ncbi:GtrA family protein [Xylophilus sp. GOD-11R]|uniref:GtrA family protein n=1 Tax=Xylophilus sp. GOD-11R TaxID=3089814 RepID=UPI00298CB75A|nr:GtrA family protein [Xylophilus sp. GOD-11R]WPB57804.1 GtrA family protein [Xylophilus sp. GOD-11R]